MPVEPPPSRWQLPRPEPDDPGDVIAVGGDLEPGTLLQAYRSGLFPMHVPDGRLGWWSPRRRGIIPLDGMRITRSLRKSVRRYVVTIDCSYREVIAACAAPSRPNGWITEEILDAYVRLHELGWSHSIETRDREGRLVGGLYGVAIGGAFFGESMFHEERDSSKVALVRLVEWMNRDRGLVLDVQWATDHLLSLGAVEIDRAEYMGILAEALEVPLLPMWEASEAGRPGREAGPGR